MDARILEYEFELMDDDGKLALYDHRLDFIYPLIKISNYRMIFDNWYDRIEMVVIIQK